MQPYPIFKSENHLQPTQVLNHNSNHQICLAVLVVVAHLRADLSTLHRQWLFLLLLLEVADFLQLFDLNYMFRINLLPIWPMLSCNSLVLSIKNVEQNYFVLYSINKNYFLSLSRS